jgi:hypothetical protein
MPMPSGRAPTDDLPADPTDEVLMAPPDYGAARFVDDGVSTGILAERIEGLRERRLEIADRFEAHETADERRHGEMMRAIEATVTRGDERGRTVSALVEAADARAHQRERWLVGLIAVLVLGVLGLAGVQVSGGGFGVEGVVGGVASAP